MAGYDKTTRHGGGVESTGEGASGDGKKTGEACKDNGSLGEGKTAGGSTTNRGGLPETPRGRKDPS